MTLTRWEFVSGEGSDGVGLRERIKKGMRIKAQKQKEGNEEGNITDPKREVEEADTLVVEESLSDAKLQG